MFGIDFSEILVIFGIALVVLGPEKLPRLARTVGKWVGRARSMARQFREQLEQEADALQRSADLRTPPPSPPPPSPPPPAAPVHTPTPSPPPPTVSIAPDIGAQVADAVANDAAAADAHAPSQQPAAPPVEQNERTG
jgi:sec-independent protein translocase protein TatB